MSRISGDTYHAIRGQTGIEYDTEKKMYISKTGKPMAYYDIVRLIGQHSIRTDKKLSEKGIINQRIYITKNPTADNEGVTTEYWCSNSPKHTELYLMETLYQETDSDVYRKVQYRTYGDLIFLDEPRISSFNPDEYEEPGLLEYIKEPYDPRIHKDPEECIIYHRKHGIDHMDTFNNRDDYIYVNFLGGYVNRSELKMLIDDPNCKVHQRFIDLL